MDRLYSCVAGSIMYFIGGYFWRKADYLGLAMSILIPLASILLYAWVDQ